jgi:hypothetical protein
MKREIRKFETGATRDSSDDKIDFEGFLSPIVLQRFGEYMMKHRVQADGNLRDSDNWQRGMSRECYIKSGLRHFHDWWLEHRGHKSREGLEDALCGLLFNVQGYLFEVLKNKDDDGEVWEGLSPEDYKKLDKFIEDKRYDTKRKRIS